MTPRKLDPGSLVPRLHGRELGLHSTRFLRWWARKYEQGLFTLDYDRRTLEAAARRGAGNDLLLLTQHSWTGMLKRNLVRVARHDGGGPRYELVRSAALSVPWTARLRRKQFSFPRPSGRRRRTK